MVLTACEPSAHEHVKMMQQRQAIADAYAAKGLNLDQDDAQCRFQSAAATVNMQPYALVPLERIATQRQLWELCMRGKGY